MGRVRQKGTHPEIEVRKLIYAMGFRYRLHVKALPGTPDLVFRKSKAIIFVHGCFWHLHQGCSKGRLPSSNTAFWTLKLSRNVARDAEQQRMLRREGWRILVFWECQLSDKRRLAKRICSFLKR